MRLQQIEEEPDQEEPQAEHAEQAEDGFEEELEVSSVSVIESEEEMDR